MSSELMFLLAALVNILCTFLASRGRVEWLFSVIGVNLVLVSIFGANLITIFGFVTNVANVFYGCVFLGAYFLLERYGRGAGIKIVWFGPLLVLFFVAMSQFVVSVPFSMVSNGSLDVVEQIAPFSQRIIIVSLLTYVFAQYVNIYIYEWVRSRTRGKYLWLRSFLAAGISQLVDSMIFFSIAFVDLPARLLIQAIFIGWIIKTLVVVVGIPFLYANAYLDRKRI